MHAASTSSLRAALLLALTVARQGERQQPPVVAPARLRPYLGFAKVPPAALEACRRVVEDDEAFRRRVAADATVDQVGSLGFLWLTRPEQWEATAASLQAEQERDRTRTGIAQRLADVEQREVQARRALDALDQERRELSAALDAARNEMLEREREVRELHAALGEARDAIGEGERQRQELLRQLKAAEAKIAEDGAELRRLRREREAQLARPIGQAEHSADAAPPAAAAAVDDAITSGVAMSAPQPVAPLDAPIVRARDPEVEQALRRAVAEASHAAAVLGDSLRRARSVLGHDPALPVTNAPRPVGDVPAGPAGPVRPVPVGSTGERPARRAPARRPVSIPPGMFDDSTATAEYLMRLSGIRVLVDGYNVAKQGWPDLPLPLQRRRLLDALVALQARTGARIEVIFDGVDAELAPHRAVPQRLRVEFTVSGIEADERLLELVGQTPTDQSVLVVTSDRRVREGARRRGANLLYADQLLALLR